MNEQNINWLDYRDGPRLAAQGVQFTGPNTNLTAIFPEGTQHTQLPDGFETNRHLYVLPSSTEVIVEDQGGGVRKAMYIQEH